MNSLVFQNEKSPVNTGADSSTANSLRRQKPVLCGLLSSLTKDSFYEGGQEGNLTTIACGDFKLKHSSETLRNLVLLMRCAGSLYLTTDFLDFVFGLKKLIEFLSYFLFVHQCISK